MTPENSKLLENMADLIKAYGAAYFERLEQENIKKVGDALRVFTRPPCDCSACMKLEYHPVLGCNCERCTRLRSVADHNAAIKDPVPICTCRTCVVPRSPYPTYGCACERCVGLRSSLGLIPVEKESPSSELSRNRKLKEFSNIPGGGEEFPIFHLIHMTEFAKQVKLIRSFAEYPCATDSETLKGLLNLLEKIQRELKDRQSVVLERPHREEDPWNKKEES